ncbi:AbrB/MazE/SpoVT family DNA-binding domain-containing protein [Paenibacillus jamilae]|jgi:transcriptional pleiotropic regulator of transition state genes|uniref:AbrB/MazE/SpoVT family DNA-binding domain-containing protein n=4 Tax=Bacillus TaxID=1386 RepID=A0A9X8IY97_BACCE|nr:MULTISPECIES: AbrB/MazE/SpoVT family DNA-binding domain-containing protein [Bacillus cereus group]MEB4843876.1 AbrB/MazE/SpoVT family DNA-binding domain-containing protein [Paenibacillus jamilae]PAW41487.1 AbrB/MazE/SpoVT family DNA-binding domain-containing protein [Bacillus toyonensis]MCR6851990.1 AbrB/MazE/SpoVT family DNA-binding domain-containing protein [Bacillus thuringiensis]MDA1761596.1 AbrB/MazE/SpoVT family DNA-binding domain-containing protein [Bacillus cereus]MDR4286609.1 AbrB/
MKNTGVARKVDELGRVVIPVELRRTLGIVEGTTIDFHVEGENIVLRKYENSCFVTGEVSETNIELLGGRMFLSKEGAIELLDLIQKSGMAHA